MWPAVTCAVLLDPAAWMRGVRGSGPLAVTGRAQQSAAVPASAAQQQNQGSAHSKACPSRPHKSPPPHTKLFTHLACAFLHAVCCRCCCCCCCCCCCQLAVWQLHEQTSIALMECGSPAAALPLVKAVLLKFDDRSIRARRLQVGTPLCFFQRECASPAAPCPAPLSGPHT
jgi:hypothetical protein